MAHLLRRRALKTLWAGILSLMGRGRSQSGPAGTGEAFAERLRRMREAAGLTQEELAFRAGLSPSAVGVLERGARRRPYPHTVRVLADALDLDGEGRATLLAAVPKRSGASAAGEAVPALPELPRPATPLVGRGREVEEARSLLTKQDVRLLTFTGIGGVGKTRLAAEVASEVAASFPDGAAFVGLAPLGDPALVLPTIVRTLGFREPVGRTPGEALVDHLRERNLLLVLDNFEHLLEAAVGVAGLIEACPELVVLATSRAPLRIRAEKEYPVPPLALPSSTRKPTEDDVLGSPAVRLLLERARAVRPGFEITGENAGAVAEVCWRLAGLPLALELAATKVRFLDPAALLSRLDRALSAAWARDLPERQRTMHATLDWSHDLLSEAEQALFRRLSVFSGGFTLEAAEAVGTADGGEELLEPLVGLVEQSLVEAEPDPGGEGVRYGMLEPVRQYASEKLAESGEVEEVQRRHAEQYLALADEAEPELMGPEQEAWLGRLEREHDNLRAALGRSLEGTDDEHLGLRLSASLWSFWYTHGHLSEGRRWIEHAVSSDGPAPAGARALGGAGYISLFQGDYDAASGFLERSLILYRGLSDKEGIASSLVYLGFVAVLGERDLETLPALYEEAASLGPELRDPRVVANLTLFSGLVALSQGEMERSIALHEEALALFRRIGDVQGMGHCLNNLALGAFVRAAYEEASELIRENLLMAQRSDHKLIILYSLFGLGLVAASRGQPARAARLLGRVEMMQETLGLRITPLARSYTNYESHLAEARSRLDEAAWEEAWSEGRAMTQQEAVDYALGADATRGDSAPQ